MDKSYANRLRRELETGKTLKGQPLDEAMRRERLTKLRRRAATLPPATGMQRRRAWRSWRSPSRRT